MSLCLMFISKSEVLKKICVAKDLTGLGKALLSPLWAGPFHYHVSNNDIWLNIHITSENFPSARLQVKYFRITQWCNELFPRRFSRKEPASQCRLWNAGDLGSVPGWGRPPGGGNGTPFQYSCLKNSTDRGSWELQATGRQRVGHEWAPEHAHSRANTVGFSVWQMVRLHCCCCSVIRFCLILGDPMDYTLQGIV